MSDVIYAVVFKGEVREGFETDSVKTHLTKLLKLNSQKLDVLFSGKQVVIKKTADKKIALNYARVMKKVGADIKVRVIKPKAAQTAKTTVEPVAAVTESQSATATESQSTAATESQSAAAAESQSATAEESQSVAAADSQSAPPADSELTLSPNEGFIIEPSTPAPPPALDLSGMVLSEAGDGFLVEPSEQEFLELDLSEFSIKDNDGTPLVESAPDDAPVVEVPDFGLDEPGAILETIPDERELLNPDTSGMSIAITGSDLLNPEEKDQEPPPEAPDTSKIHLEPNFD